MGDFVQLSDVTVKEYIQWLNDKTPWSLSRWGDGEIRSLLSENDKCWARLKSSQEKKTKAEYEHEGEVGWSSPWPVYDGLLGDFQGKMEDDTDHEVDEALANQLHED